VGCRRTNLTKTPFLVLFVILISVGIGTASLSNAEVGTVPDWFRGVAGFWAEEKISTSEFLSSLEFLLEQEVIQVEGYGLLSEAQADGIDQTSIEELWSAIGDLQNQVDAIELTPGPVGSEGPAGADASISTYVNQITRPTNTRIGQVTQFNLTPECSEGDYVTGGGFSTSGGSWKIFRSCPAEVDSFGCIKPGQTQEGWKVMAAYLGMGGGSGESISVFVSCIDATP